MMNRTSTFSLFLGAVLLLAAGSATAQTAFALRNAGQPLMTDDARMAGRGGWGMAVTDSMHPGFKNLASLAAIKHVAISFTAYGEHADNEDEAGSRKTNRVLTPDIRLALPVVKERLALTAGFRIYRSSQYTTLDPAFFGWAFEDSVFGGVQFRREGSQFKVPLGVAAKVLPPVSLSAAFNMENGSVREELSNFYDFPNLGEEGDYDPVYLDDIRELRDDYEGKSYTLGVLVDPLPWLQVGATWTPAYDLDVERRVQHLLVGQDYETEFTMKMPDEYQAGVQVSFAERWRLGGDYRVMDFRKLEGREDWLKDAAEEYGYSVGIERKRARIRRGGFKNLPLRAGYTRKQWGYMIGDEPVVERIFSLGTGFPFRGNMGQLDVAVSYGMIGDMEKNDMESSYWRFTVSVTGLERWW